MKHKAHGFTLIELMVTVAIIGLALTIVFLQLDTFLPASNLQKACRELIFDLENLRLSAIMVFKRSVHLEYDLDNEGYWAYLPYEVAYDVDQEGRPKIRFIGPGRTELLEFKELPERIVFENIQLGPQSQGAVDGKVVTVLLNPDGSVTGHIAHVRDEQYEKIFSLRFASLTGFSEILDGKVEYEDIDDSDF